MEKQLTETGLSPVRVRDEDTLEYCAMPGCGQQIPVRIHGSNEESGYSIPGIGKVCESCAIEH